MKPDKAQTRKAIVFAALIAVLVGYGVYSMTGRKGSAPPSAQPARLTRAQTSRPAGVAVAIAEQISKAFGVSVAVAKKDPFAPRIVPESALCGPPPPSAKPLARLATRQPTLPFLPGGGNLALSVEPRLAAPEPEPLFVLTGIIKGDTDVAIIRAGSSDRHIVKKGQMINGTYRVQTIKRDGVVLTRGNRSIYLKLGGRTNAS